MSYLNFQINYNSDNHAEIQIVRFKFFFKLNHTRSDNRNKNI